jgi:hypothetical protein
MSVGTQLVAEVEFELSDRKFRFFELTRSLLVRHPDRDDFDGCWMSTIGRGPIAPGYSGLVVIEDLTHPVRMAPEDRFIIWYGDEVGRGVVLEPLFKDPMGPTADELRRWADSGSYTPEQDWDLCIWSDDSLLDTFVELATDDRTQKHEFFLSLLYGRVGDAVRSGMVSKRTVGLIEELGDSDHQPLRRFAQRAKALLATPQLFGYDDWCRGGLSKDDADWPPAGLSPQPAAEP